MQKYEKVTLFWKKKSRHGVDDSFFHTWRQLSYSQSFTHRTLKALWWDSRFGKTEQQW